MGKPDDNRYDNVGKPDENRYEGQGEVTDMSLSRQLNAALMRKQEACKWRKVWSPRRVMSRKSNQIN